MRDLEIPGTTVVHLNEDDTVDSITFTPHASGAGYFGPDFIDTETGDELTANPNAAWADDAAPIWRSIQKHLLNSSTHPGSSDVEWTE